MKARLKRLHSSDVFDLKHETPLDIGQETPIDVENFYISVQAMIGSDDSDGEDTFGFVACTPKWVQENLDRESYLFLSHALIIERYSYDAIWNSISALCDSIEADDWTSVAEQLNRYGQWEFDNYKEYGEW